MGSRGTEASTRRSVAIGIVAVIVSVGVAFAGVQLVQQTALDPAPELDSTRIESCSLISDSGRYTLTRDLENRSADRCIRITADDVFFDGNGHAIDGVGAFGSGGISVRGGSNVTVRNATVTHWDDGIRYVNAEEGVIERTTTANNRVGLTLLGTNRTLVSNNTAVRNAVYGISIQEASNGNTVENNTAASNTLFGIHLVRAGATDNTLVSNTATENEYGIVLIGARGNTIVGNVADRNRIAGIWLSEADRNRLANNSVTNRFYGIYLGDQSDRNAIVSNVAADNAVGVRLIHSDRNSVSSNVATENRAEGILLLASDNNVITDNVLSGNGRPIVVVRSKNVTVSSNDDSRLVRLPTERNAERIDGVGGGSRDPGVGSTSTPLNVGV